MSNEELMCERDDAFKIYWGKEFGYWRTPDNVAMFSTRSTFNSAWQAATASKQREIDALQGYIDDSRELDARLEAECGVDVPLMPREILKLRQQLLEQAAQVEKMREACSAIDNDAEECEGDDGELVFSISADAIHLLRDTLTIEPSAALLAHDNEVAAKAMEEAAEEFRPQHKNDCHMAYAVELRLRNKATERRNRK